MAGADTITAQLDKIMTEYAEDTETIVGTCAQMAAKKTRTDIVAASPVGTGKTAGRYKRGWSVKRESSRGLVSFIVHNKTDYQLTHLLEKSHVIKNQFGEYGRTNPTPHIAPAAEAGADYFVELVEKNLSQ